MQGHISGKADQFTVQAVSEVSWSQGSGSADGCVLLFGENSGRELGLDYRLPGIPFSLFLKCSRLRYRYSS